MAESTSPRTFALADVEKHNKLDDIWLVIHNKVYNVTKYCEDHPGGLAVLHEVAGTDATEAFEEVGHSLDANEDLQNLYIGDLAKDDHAEKIEVFRPTFHDVGQTAAVIVPAKNRNKRRLGIPTLATVIAVGTGAAVWMGRHQGLGGTQGERMVKLLRQALSMSANIFPSSFTSGAGRSSIFWLGAGIATVAQVSLSVTLGLWAWSKLDVQEEFTHYPSRRISKPARHLPVLRVPTTSSTTSATRGATKIQVVDPQAWRPFKLVRKTLVSPNVYRLVFALPRPDDILGLPTGQHVALRAIVEGKPVARSYTPMSNNSDLGRIELLIKVYDKGLLTKHLEGMQVGETIDIRGPKGAMQYKPLEYAKHIGMVAGGTGITPMFQMIRAICEDESDTTKMSLLYANNTEADILLREELDAYVKQCPQKLSVHYVLARPSEGWAGSTGFINEDMIKKFLPAAADDTKMLLCGPPPMVQAVSKTLVGLGFKAPGAVSKATDQVFLF